MDVIENDPRATPGFAQWGHYVGSIKMIGQGELLSPAVFCSTNIYVQLDLY